MSHETAPDQGPDPADSTGGEPGGLLQQMEALLAAVNADLAGLDARLQSVAGHDTSEKDRNPGI